MRSAAAPEPPRARSLVGRVVDLGVARVSVLAGRGLLFLLLGLALDPTSYGRIAVLLTTAGLFVVLLDLGLPLLLQRTGAASSDDAARAIPGIVLLRVGALVPVLVLYGLVARHLLGAEATVGAVAAVGVYVLAAPLAQTVLLFLRGARQTGVEARVLGVQSVLEVAAAAGWLALHGEDPVPLFVVLAAIRLTFVAVLATSGTKDARGLDRGATRRFLVEHRASLGLYFALAVAQFTMLQADALILSMVRPTDEVGRYFACTRVAWLLHLPSELLLAAAMARLAAAVDAPARFGRILGAVHRLSLTWTVLLVGIAVAEPALVAGTMLGDDVGDVAHLFALVVLASSASWCPPFALPLALERRPIDVVVAYAGAAAVSVAAQLVLAPRLGAEGAAYAAIAGYATLKAMTFVLLRRRGLPTLRALEVAPAAGLGLAVAALHRVAPGPAWFVAGAAALGVAALTWQARGAVRAIEVDR